jgi:hypothetical protein
MIYLIKTGMQSVVQTYFRGSAVAFALVTAALTYLYCRGVSLDDLPSWLADIFRAIWNAEATARKLLGDAVAAVDPLVGGAFSQLWGMADNFLRGIGLSMNGLTTLLFRAFLLFVFLRVLRLV